MFRKGKISCYSSSNTKICIWKWRHINEISGNRNAYVYEIACRNLIKPQQTTSCSQSHLYRACFHLNNFNYFQCCYLFHKIPIILWQLSIRLPILDFSSLFAPNQFWWFRYYSFGFSEPILKKKNNWFTLPF